MLYMEKSKRVKLTYCVDCYSLLSQLSTAGPADEPKLAHTETGWYLKFILNTTTEISITARSVLANAKRIHWSFSD